MLRTALLGGNTITLDADLSKYIETLSEQGIIEGLEVSSGSVDPGKAWVKATRSNGETIMVLVQNTEALAVDTSGTKKIWLEIRQEAIDNGLLNNEDGTGIASIKTGPSVPSQNSLLLASVADGVITDERNLIPKIQSVAQRTDSLEEKMTNAEGKIEKLEEAGANENFSKKGLIGASYEDGDTLYFNKILKLYEVSSYTLAWNTSYKKVYFIAMANGESFNSLSVPFYRMQNPMDGISLEIRNVVPHTGDEKIKYKPGEIIYATGNVLPTSIDLTSKMIEITLNNPVNVAKGTLIAVVIQRNLPQDTNNNYYIPSGAMTNNGPVGINRYIGINSTDTPVMIGGGAVACICSGIEQECYTKSKINLNKANLKSPFRLNSGASNYVAQQQLGTIGVGKYRAIVYIKSTNHSPQGNTFELKLNGVKIKQLPNPTNTNNQTFDLGEIEILTNGMLSISCKMNTSSSGYYLQGEVRLENLVSEDCDIEYIPEQVSPIGTKQKLLYYGMVNNKWKELYTKDYQKGFIAEISATGSGETKNMIIPSPGIVILSCWTDYKRVSCSINGITIIELYHSNSGTVKETITVPVKGGEIIEVKKREYSGGVSAKFISL